MLVPEDLHPIDVKTEDSDACESKLLESVGNHLFILNDRAPLLFSIKLMKTDIFNNVDK
jgi:hypothetical protein